MARGVFCVDKAMSRLLLGTQVPERTGWLSEGESVVTLTRPYSTHQNHMLVLDFSRIPRFFAAAYFHQFCRFLFRVDHGMNDLSHKILEGLATTFDHARLGCEPVNL